jgi:WD40 repeat protein
MTRLHILLPALLPALLLSFSGHAFAEKKANDAPAKKQERHLVLIKAFDARLVRTNLAYKVFSPDKKLFAGYYRDGFDEVISIHETKTGKQIKRFLAQGDEIKELKFTPDGKLLASRCVNTNRKGWALWDVSTGRLVLRLPVPPSDD